MQKKKKKSGLKNTSHQKLKLKTVVFAFRKYYWSVGVYTLVK